MKVFVVFLVIVFGCGIIFRRVKPSLRNLALFLLCVIVTILYFFFNKI